MSQCLDENTALELLEGRLSSTARTGVDAHLAGCDGCRAMVAELAKLDRAEDEQLAVAAGQRIGPYVVERQASEGASGVIYRARDERTGRVIALKVVSDPALRARFEREASVLARLEHEAIVRYVDHGPLPGRSGMFLAMEWLDGEDLREQLLRGALGWRAARILGLRLAAALWQAHTLGCVHRDLSPRNVFLPEGRIDRAKLLDFGLVRIADSELARTTSKAILGTPFYMAPEQIRDPSRVDGRADLFGLGALLFEAISGVRPFEGSDLFGVWVKIVDLPTPDLRRLVREPVPEPFVRLIEGLLEKDPSARPPTAGDVHRSLASIAESPAAPSLPPVAASARTAPPPPQPRASGVWPIGAVVLGSLLLVAGGVGAGAYWLGTHQPPPADAVAPPAPPALKRLPDPAPSDVPSGPTGPIDDSTTGAAAHYTCGGDTVEARKHGRYAPEPAFAAVGFAVTAGGSCKLTLEDCDIAGPHSVQVLGDAAVVLRRCKVQGQLRALGPTTTLVLEATTVHEPPQSLGGGKIIRR
jgi:serine/threonine protein kinase